MDTVCFHEPKNLAQNTHCSRYSRVKQCLPASYSADNPGDGALLDPTGTVVSPYPVFLSCISVNSTYKYTNTTSFWSDVNAAPSSGQPRCYWTCSRLGKALTFGTV